MDHDVIYIRARHLYKGLNVILHGVEMGGLNIVVRTYAVKSPD